eukprot:3439438-Lingulodinium_polyedra.AAC.2
MWRWRKRRATPRRGRRGVGSWATTDIPKAETNRTETDVPTPRQKRPARGPRSPGAVEHTPTTSAPTAGAEGRTGQCPTSHEATGPGLGPGGPDSGRRLVGPATSPPDNRNRGRHGARPDVRP